MKMWIRWLAVAALMSIAPLSAQVNSPPALPPLATANLTWNIATTGSDGNPCTSGSPCLTLQHVINLANAYNWNNQYFPTINIANGTYAGTQVALPQLSNCPNGGVIIGNTTTPTNVSLVDGGTGYVFAHASYSQWTINGVSVAGTFGGFNLNPYAILNWNHINFAGSSGTYSGLLVQPHASTFAGNAITLGGIFTISSTSMNVFIFSRGITIFDASTITFSNAITVNALIEEDATTSFFAFIGSTFVNPTNVTANNNGLMMTNGPFFESDTTSLSGASQLARSNFPGGKVSIDASSRFLADTLVNTVGLVGGCTSFSAAGVVVICDGAGNLWLDYNQTFAGNWTASTSVLNIVSSSTSSTAFQLINSSVGGHDFFFGAVGSGGLFGLVAGELGFFDVTSGNTLFWFDLSANMTLSGQLGFSAQGAFAIGAADANVSRISAGVLAVGNGASGDFSGTIKATHWQSGASAGVSCSGTPTSSFASVNGIVTHC